MCGIAGFIDFHRSAESSTNIIRKMVSAINHRGPDADGFWSLPSRGIYLGHARLSIIDLSDHGSQPMTSHSGRFVISYNGEVYNFQSLKQELVKDGIVFRGHSDTEVLLAACEAWGVEETLLKLNGMFAFALYDKTMDILYLCRDRLGEKPLYYSVAPWGMVFGSEIKAILSHPEVTRRIDPSALAEFCQRSFINAPRSIFSGVNKLSAGHWGAYHLDSRQWMEPKPYWSMDQVLEQGKRQPFSGDRWQAAVELHNLLQDAVEMRMVADVPVGTFLSGGVDSSLVTALMQASSAKPVKTFSIGFSEAAFDESSYARAVAQHLRTEHHELIVTPKLAQEVIPKLPAIFDEPFADSSQIPTFLVSQLARQHVTVSLSGDGGDELFGGYIRYLKGKQFWERTAWLGTPLRQSIGKSLRVVSPRAWDRILKRIPIGRKKILQSISGDRIHKLGRVLGSSTPGEFYSQILSSGGQDPYVLGDVYSWVADAPSDLDFCEQMMLWDTRSYLPDDILVKVDRAAMAVSLESRIPLLDHRLVEFAWSLPLSHRVFQGTGKWLLRQVLDQYVPRPLIERPKMGFGVPIDRWLRHDLREWADDLLSAQRLQRQGLLDVDLVRQKWDEHLSGERNWQGAIWNILMFQAWWDQLGQG